MNVSKQIHAGKTEIDRRTFRTDDVTFVSLTSTYSQCFEYEYRCLQDQQNDVGERLHYGCTHHLPKYRCWRTLASQPSWMIASFPRISSGRTIVEGAFGRPPGMLNFETMQLHCKFKQRNYKQMEFLFFEFTPVHSGITLNFFTKV